MAQPINAGKGIGAALAKTKGKANLSPQAIAALMKMLQQRGGGHGPAAPMPGAQTPPMPGGAGPVMRRGR